MIIPIELKKEIRQLAQENGLKLRFIEKKVRAEGYANSRYGEKVCLIRVFAHFRKLEFKKKRHILLHELGHLIFEAKRRKEEKQLIKLAEKYKALFFNNPLLSARAVDVLLNIYSEICADSYIEKFGYRGHLETKSQLESVRKKIEKVKDRRRHFKTVLKKLYKKPKEYLPTIVAYNRWVISALKQPRSEWSKITLKFFPNDFLTIVRKVANVLQKEKPVINKIEMALPYIREEMDYLYRLRCT